MPLTDEILLKVAKPARYIGNEINMAVKIPEEADIRFAFCFPDVYEVGMSHLGLQILYFFLNDRSDTYCERFFAPWNDMEDILRESEQLLFSLETQTALNKFDIIGFTLQYEMSYTNIVNMLNLGGLPVLAKDRDEDAPIVCAGGPCAYNPEPLSDIIDFFYIGEGEVSLNSILDLYKKHKKGGGSKKEFLQSLLSVEGVYIPCFYDVKYKENGCIDSIAPNNANAPEVIRKVIVSDLDKSFYPEKQLVPLIEVVHDRVTLEIFRGCIRGCRFCQAGYVYRPVREKSSETLLGQAERLIKTSGHDEISLVSLSTGDYSHFKELSEGLLSQFKKDKVNISLPSLRIDAFTLEQMEKVQEIRRSSLTFAPEAGTQRMRDVINKGITEEEIIEGSGLAFDGGWDRIKLYFMVGLPTETDEDILGIVRLSENIVKKYYENGPRQRPLSLVVSTSCFVPKPFTPFQWEAQNDYEDFMQKQQLIKKSIRKKQIKYSYHDAKISILEGAMARGDRRLSKTIIRAWELGARFDGWTEHFKFDIWKQAFEDTGLDMKFYASRERDIDEVLPWEHISIGVSKEFLLKEREKALKAEISKNCREQCLGCGVTSFGGGVCTE